MTSALHRNSTRLRDFDYASSGAYFATICTAQRAHLFGEIVDGQMVLNGVGQIALETWSAIPEHFTSVFLDEFVIMPNHIHGVLCIERPTVGALCLAHMGVTHAAPLHSASPRFNVEAGSLGAIVRSFKAAVTKRARAASSNADLHVWQRGYHDHVVRDISDLERIRVYISTNPLEWHLDEYAAITVAA